MKKKITQKAVDHAWKIIELRERQDRGEEEEEDDDYCTDYSEERDSHGHPYS